MDCLPHDADFCRLLLGGEKPEEVYATGARSNEELAEAMVADTATVTAKYKKLGVVVHVCLFRGATYGYDNRIEVFGTKGRFVVETPPELSVRCSDKDSIHAPALMFSFPQRFAAAFAAEVDLFARGVLAEPGAKWLVDRTACIAAQKFAMAAAASKRDGTVKNL
ncbi:unnamed protein product [Amoebophrya sp. A25]|nr:unnamed protein product [Amoebophrya sp. A25]|eukprot:GSA25T00011327001.1